MRDFRFTGWGSKYQSQADDAVNQHLAAQSILQWPMEGIDFDLEGGGIETDGLGTLLTTRHCLLESNRNPGMDQTAVEAQLAAHLGIERVLWVGSGYLDGDDTDSHIDNLVRFASADTLVFAQGNHDDAQHYEALDAMHQELTRFRTPQGQPYRLIGLPLPPPQFDPQSGSRLPASYVNFLILNEILIVPSFDTEADQLAACQLKQAFPEHRINWVDGRQLIRQFGGPHCATMQLPPGAIRLPINRTVEKS
jgi:agmatine/peptidylarginine deiminase